MSVNFLFGVPLRARATSQDWGRVVFLFQCCMRSLLNQKDENFRVIVACHDIPEIPELADRRVQILQMDIPLPTNFDEQMEDKAIKSRAAYAAMRTLGGGYTMLVDADDLVSNRLVGFCRKDAHPSGYIFDVGYEYDCSSNRISVAPRFNNVCGSSGIFHFTPDELPLTADDPEIRVSDKFGNHTTWAQAAVELGRPVVKLPFKGAVYVSNNGENHSVLTGNIGWRRRLLRRMMPSGRVSRAIRAEFALPENFDTPARASSAA